MKICAILLAVFTVSVSASAAEISPLVPSEVEVSGTPAIKIYIGYIKPDTTAEERMAECRKRFDAAFESLRALRATVIQKNECRPAPNPTGSDSYYASASIAFVR